MGSLKTGAVGPTGPLEWDHKGRTQIVQIIISHDDLRLRSLQFQYLENGRLVTSDIIGRQDFSSPVFDTITFRSHEYITKLEGLYTSSSIEKLCIHTNIKEYEIFKAENKQPSNSITLYNEDKESSKRFSFKAAENKQPSNSITLYKEDKESSKRFSFNFGGENQFGGFHGTHRSGDPYSRSSVCSIGAYFNRLEALPSRYFQGEPSQHSGDDEITSSV